MKTTLLAIVACLFLPLPASATTFELGGFIGGDFNLGADTLLVLEFEDGSSQDTSAGNGLILAIGPGLLFFDDQEHRLETQLTVGIKYSSMQPAENASLDFTRVPIELLAFYRHEKFHFRVGGGLAWYATSSLEGGGDLLVDAEFEPALGGIMQADFVWDAFYAGLRYTILSLHVTGAPESVAANSLGVTIGYFHRFES